MKVAHIFNWILTAILAVVLMSAGFWVNQWLQESRILRQVIERLSAESRIAEVLVTKSEYDENSRKIRTTIKFLEYDASGKPLEPKYFTFQGNIIQFQSLVIRFQDSLIKAGDKVKGKSAYLFLKAFVLDQQDTQVFDITKTEGIPDGYKIEGEPTEFEKSLWENFWSYALDPASRERSGIKNAQLEAPGSMFVPGTIYSLHIEHDGGIRIDAQPIPEILKGETLS